MARLPTASTAASWVKRASSLPARHSTASRGTSVLVVSHDLALIKQMRKRVLILDHGKLADDISPHELAE
ncbi:hypothetical protein D3C71_1788540 [compost metagenome]